MRARFARGKDAPRDATTRISCHVTHVAATKGPTITWLSADDNLESRN